MSEWTFQYSLPIGKYVTQSCESHKWLPIVWPEASTLYIYKLGEIRHCSHKDIIIITGEYTP